MALSGCDGDGKPTGLGVDGNSRGAEGQIYFVDMASLPVADNRGRNLPHTPHHKAHKDYFFICH